MENINYDKPFLTFDEQIDHLANTYNLIITDRNQAKLLLSSLSYYDLINGYKECFMVNEKYIDNIKIEDLYDFLELDRTIQSILIKYSIYVENRFKNLLAYEIAKNYGVSMDLYLNRTNYKSSSRLEYILNRLFKIPNSKHVLNPTRHYLKKNHIPPWILFKNATFNDTIDLFANLKNKDAITISDYLFSNFIDLDENYKKEFSINSLIIVRKFRNKIAHNLQFIKFRSKPNQLILKKISPLFYGSLIEKEDFEIKRGMSDPYAMILSIISLLNEDFLVFKFILDLQRLFFIYKNDPKGNGDEMLKRYCDITNIPYNLDERFERFIIKKVH